MALIVFPSSALAQQTGSLTGISLPTEVRLQAPGWWPTKGDPPRNAFVGDETCTLCHKAEASTYLDAAMSQASGPAATSPGFLQHPRVSFQSRPFRYLISTGDEKSVLSVSDGRASLSQDLQWAFGKGHMGQTYVYEEGGNYYESHLSFFTSIQALDITPGQFRSIPTSLESAVGRRMDPGEPRLCFGCHTTASAADNKFDPHQAIPGVRCEACHGPGARHVAVASPGLEDQADAEIFRPGKLGPFESVDFCGACHRTWQDVVKNGFIGLGVYNVRFAPYRLENSRCWGNGDARLTCVACHNPHKPLGTDPSSYDSACLRCHVLRGAKRPAGHPGAACPVATSDCVSCHMPKVSPPNLHSTFTDHWIRVVHPGAPYPD